MVKTRPGYLPRPFKLKNNEYIKELIKNPATVVVDVRSSWENESSHIPDAKNIPLEEVPYKVEEFKAFKSPVVLYCRSGNRSGMVVSILKQNGVADVYNGGGLGDMQFLLN
jgi:phage shock protein E